MNITELYKKNGLELEMTCGACPEQYDVLKDGNTVGYLRLRHGYFRAEYPCCGGETVFEGSPEGDGIFADKKERKFYLKKAMKAILKKLK
jgi:hypothetical protein